MEINLHNLHNSCYADSLLIFILVYHRIPFFLDNFYTSTKNNKDNHPAGLSVEFFNQPFTVNNQQYEEADYIAGLRYLLGQMQATIANPDPAKLCTGHRNKFREQLQAIWYRNKDYLSGKVTNLKLADNWKATDLESSDLLQYLLYLFNVPPDNIYLVPESGFRYDMNELGKKISLTPDELSVLANPNIQIPDMIYNVFPTASDEVIPAIQTAVSLDYKQFIMPSTESQTTLIYPKDNTWHQLFLEVILPNEMKRADIPQDTKADLSQEVKDKYAGLINRDIVKFNKWIYSEDSKAFINYVARKDLPIIFINVNRIFRHHNDRKELSSHPIDLTEYITNPVTGTKYILIGGTIHMGGHTGGHYTAYIRSPANNDFYYYNDIGSTVGRIGDYNKLLHAYPPISNFGTTLIYIKELDYQIQHDAGSASYDSNNNGGPPTRHTHINQQVPIFPSGKKKRQTRRRMRKKLEKEQAKLARQQQEVQAELARQQQEVQAELARQQLKQKQSQPTKPSKYDPEKINFIELG